MGTNKHGRKRSSSPSKSGRRAKSVPKTNPPRLNPVLIARGEDGANDSVDEGSEDGPQLEFLSSPTPLNASSQEAFGEDNVSELSTDVASMYTARTTASPICDMDVAKDNLLIPVDEKQPSFLNENLLTDVVTFDTFSSLAPKPKYLDVSPSTYKSTIPDFQIAQSYTRLRENEINLSLSDIVSVVGEYNPANAWTQVISRSWSDKNGQMGFVPTSCLVSVLQTSPPSNPAESTEPYPGLIMPKQASAYSYSNLKTSTAQSSIGVPENVTLGSAWYAKFEHIPDRDDELYIQEHDYIIVLECPAGGWWKGVKNINSRTPYTGWFPAAVLDFPEPHTPSQFESKSTSSEKPPTLATAEVPKVESKSAFSEILSPISLFAKTGSWFKASVKSIPGTPTAMPESPVAAPAATRLRSISAPYQKDDSETAPDSTLKENSVKLNELRSSSKVMSVRHSRSLSGTTTNERVNNTSPSPTQPQDKSIGRPDQEISHVISWKHFSSAQELNSMNAVQVRRNTILWELLSTEKEYVRDLKVLIEHVIDPLAKIIPGKAVNALFSNIRQVLSVNQEFLRLLEKSDFPNLCLRGLGDVFLKMSDSFVCYNLFCSKTANFSHKLSQLSASKPEVKALVEEIHRNAIMNRLSVGSFMIKPIQRICKYPLLLKEIIKCTPTNHPDYPTLILALDRIEGIIDIINEGARQGDHVVTNIEEIQSRFAEKLNIVTPTRFVVRDDTVFVMLRDHKKPRKLFIFNDILILARKDWRDKLHLVEKTALKQCRVSDIEDDQEKCSHVIELEIVTEGRSVNRYLITLYTKEVKQAWLSAFKNITQFPIKLKLLSQANDEGILRDEAITNEDTPNSAEVRYNSTTLALQVQLEEKDLELRKAEQLFSGMTQELTSKEALLEERIARHSSAILDLDKSKKALELAESSCSQLKEKIFIAQSTIQKHESAIENLRQERQASEEASNNARLKIAELESTVQKQKLELESIKFTLAQNELKIKDLSAMNKADQAALTSLHEEKEDLLLQINDQVETIVQLEIKENNLKEELEAIKSSISDQNLGFQHLLQETIRLKETMRQLEQDLAEKHEQTAAAEEQSKQLAEFYEKDRQKLEGLLDAERVKLVNTLDSHQNELSQITRQATANQQASHQQLDLKNQELTEMKENLKKMIAAANIKFSKALEVQNKEKDALINQQTALQATITTLQEQIVDLTSQIASAQQIEEQLAANLKSSQSEYQLARDRANDEGNFSNRELGQARGTTESDYTFFNQNDHSTLQKKITVLEEALATANQELAEMNFEREVNEKEKIRLTKENDRLSLNPNQLKAPEFNQTSARIESEFSQFKSQAVEERSKLLTTISELETSVANARRDLNNSVWNRAGEVRDASRTNQQHENEISELNTIHEREKREINAKMLEVEKSNNRNALFRESLESENAELYALVQQLDTDLQAKCSDWDSCAKYAKKLRRLNYDLEQELTKERVSKRELMAKLDSLADVQRKTLERLKATKVQLMQAESFSDSFKSHASRLSTLETYLEEKIQCQKRADGIRESKSHTSNGSIEGPNIKMLAWEPIQPEYKHNEVLKSQQYELTNLRLAFHDIARALLDAPAPPAVNGDHDVSIERPVSDSQMIKVLKCIHDIMRQNYELNKKVRELDGEARENYRQKIAAEYELERCKLQLNESVKILEELEASPTIKEQLHSMQKSLKLEMDLREQIELQFKHEKEHFLAQQKLTNDEFNQVRKQNEELGLSLTLARNELEQKRAQQARLSGYQESSSELTKLNEKVQALRIENDQIKLVNSRLLFQQQQQFTTIPPVHQPSESILKPHVRESDEERLYLKAELKSSQASVKILQIKLQALERNPIIHSDIPTASIVQIHHQKVEREKLEMCQRYIGDAWIKQEHLLERLSGGKEIPPPIGVIAAQGEEIFYDLKHAFRGIADIMAAQSGITSKSTGTGKETLADPFHATQATAEKSHRWHDSIPSFLV